MKSQLLRDAGIGLLLAFGLLRCAPHPDPGPTTNENSLAYTPLGPGESMSIPITVIATPALAPDFSAEPGTYRFRFFLSIQVGGEYQQLQRERTVSDPFTLLPQ